MTMNTERPRRASLFGLNTERMMGLEPTTFCMASSTGSPAEVKGNLLFCHGSALIRLFYWSSGLMEGL